MDTSKLKALFDQSGWSNKHYNTLPQDISEIRYSWREDEAGFAELFLKSGKVLTEVTAAVDRGLYYGRDKDGFWKLCVTERTRMDYDPKQVARGIADLMDASRYLAGMERTKAANSPPE